MNNTPENAHMIDLLTQPAFCVNDGMITRCNSAAAAYLMEENTPVSQIIAIGQNEYAAFTGGCLYLTLRLHDQCFGAAVTRTEHGDVFVMDQPAQPQLQALSLAAKELRTPLSSMVIAADRLMPELSRKDPGQAAMLSKSIHQLLRLVTNMSDAAQASVPQQSRRQAVEVCSMVEEIVSKAAALMESTGIRFAFSCPAGGVYTLADTAKLERAVYNLLSNAAKFSPEGSCIAVTLTRHSNKLQLTVTDSGSGISPSAASGVFTRYLREAGLEDATQGIGLGMVLVRSAAAAHGGTVLVVKQPEGGTRVTMTMTLDQDTSQLSAPTLLTDYTGGWDHCLVELADVLPADAYKRELP